MKISLAILAFIPSLATADLLQTIDCFGRDQSAALEIEYNPNGNEMVTLKINENGGSYQADLHLKRIDWVQDTITYSQADRALIEMSATIPRAWLKKEFGRVSNLDPKGYRVELQTKFILGNSLGESQLVPVSSCESIVESPSGNQSE